MPAASAPHHLSLSIQWDADSVTLPVARPKLRRWVQSALSSAATLVVRFVGEEEGRALNATYRGRDYATNVLTFDYSPPPAVEADIVICLPVLEREALAANRPLEHHLAHLVVHGVLHAQGHDHEDEAEALLMEGEETRILRRFRIPDPHA